MPTNIPLKLANVTDLCVVCLWTTLGLALTAFFVMLGFEAGVNQLMALAG
jgi:hypothetical protein